MPDNASQKETQQVSAREQYQQKQAEKGKQHAQQKRSRTFRFVLIIVAVVISVGGVLAGIGYWLLNLSSYPPTSDLNHCEQLPPSHIVTEPLAVCVQRHMLEHADGKGRPGVIINYNCTDFSCKDDLVAELTRIAQEFPAFVYLAPYPTMDAKIALTKRGKLETLEAFDEQKIRDFIE